MDDGGEAQKAMFGYFRLGFSFGSVLAASRPVQSKIPPSRHPLPTKERVSVISAHTPGVSFQRGSLDALGRNLDVG